MSRTLLSAGAALLAGTALSPALADVPQVAADIAPVHSLVARVMDGVARVGAMNDAIVPELAWQMGRPIRYGGEFGGFNERATYMSQIAREALAPIDIQDSASFRRLIKRVEAG